jgi:hypothetical protein
MDYRFLVAARLAAAFSVRALPVVSARSFSELSRSCSSLMRSHGEVLGADQGREPPCRYRLARAESVAGFSLADPDQRLLLWLELRLNG